MEAKVKLKNAVTAPVRLPAVRRLLLGVLVLMLAAGAWSLWNYLEKLPFMIRWQVVRYLKRESHTRDFGVPFPFPSKAEMTLEAAATTAVDRDKPPARDFESLRDEYFTLKTAALRLEVAIGKSKAAEKKAALEAELKGKEEALAPIVGELWDHQKAATAVTSIAAADSSSPLAQAQNKVSSELRRKVAEASSYSEIYRCIGQQLWLADGLLKSKKLEHRRAAIGLALNASHTALNDAENGWVAARICEAYLLPNQDVATDTNKRSPLFADNFLEECANIFRRNNEAIEVAHLYEKELAKAKTAQRADWVRSQIGRAYEDAGDIKAAVFHWRQIQNKNDFRWLNRRLARLEAELKGN